MRKNTNLETKVTNIITKKPSSSREIADKIGEDRGAVTSVVNRLWKGGHIKRAKLPGRGTGYLYGLRQYKSTKDETLDILKRSGSGITGAELADILGNGVGSLSGILSLLWQEGLVSRVVNGRGYRYYSVAHDIVGAKTRDDVPAEVVPVDDAKVGDPMGPANGPADKPVDTTSIAVDVEVLAVDDKPLAVPMTHKFVAEDTETIPFELWPLAARLGLIGQAFTLADLSKKAVEALGPR